MSGPDDAAILPPDGPANPDILTTSPRRPTPAQWVAGARLRTLPAAVAPVLVGSAIALRANGFDWLTATLALLVALALQVGVNYANDYSDGIRGTDADRVGPFRLVGSGTARPAAVRAAAFASFAVAAVAGLAIVILTQHWWLLALGAACIAAAWFYTGGKHPYGYLGLGELFVFLFFGLAAVCGTTYVQLGRVPLAALTGSIAIGALTTAILVANNLRDIAGDTASGKRTLATRLGDRRTRILYLGLIGLGAFGLLTLAALTQVFVLLGLAGLLLISPAVRTVAEGGTGRALIGVLKRTGTAELVAAVGVVAGVLLGR